MKKRMIAVVMAVCALAVLAIGSTFAFFTSKDNAGNTFTMGNVNISLTETSEANPDKGIKAGEVSEDGKAVKYTGVMPGDVYSKNPRVTNTGANDAWIRVKLDVTSEDEGMQENVAALKQAIIDEMKNYEWAVKADDDGYIYYTEIVEPTVYIDLFETVTIPTTWGNEAADASFSIEISAEAVQSDNNGSTWDTASWVDFE